MQMMIAIDYHNFEEKSRAGQKILLLVSTVCKLIPLFLLMIFGFILGSGESPIFTPMVGEGKNAGAVLGSTLLAVLFAFEGWTNVGAIAGEMKNPGKDMPRAIVGGVSIIMP